MSRTEITFKFTMNTDDIQEMKENISRALDRMGRFISPLTSLEITETEVEDTEEYIDEKNYVALVCDNDYLKEYFGCFNDEQNSISLLYSRGTTITKENKLKSSLYEINKGYAKVFNIKDDAQVKQLMIELTENFNYQRVKLCSIKRTEYKQFAGQERLYFITKLEELDKDDKRAEYIFKYNLKNNYDETINFLRTKYVGHYRTVPIFDTSKYGDVIYKLLRKNIKEMKNNKYADKKSLIGQLRMYLSVGASIHKLNLSDFDHSKRALEVINETLSAFIKTDDEIKVIIDDLFDTNTHKDFYYDIFTMFTTSKFVNEAYRDLRLYVFKKLNVITDRELEIYKTTESRFIKYQIEELCVLDGEDFITTDMRKSDSWNYRIAKRIFEKMSSYVFFRELMEGADEKEREIYFEILEIRLRNNVAIKELCELLWHNEIVDESSSNTRFSDLVLKVILEELDKVGERNKMLLKSTLRGNLVLRSQGRDDSVKKEVDIATLDLRNYKNLRKELMNIKLS